jgi:XTP/dITP diphosphohydrolase/tetrapyrrole methylase family protein/MazG family protein
LVCDNADKVFEVAAKVAVIGEHGEGIGPSIGIGLGLGYGVDFSSDRPSTRASALDLGNDREATGTSERLGKGRSLARLAVGSRREFGVRDGTHPVGDLEALPRHDFRKFVHAPCYLLTADSGNPFDSGLAAPEPSPMPAIDDLLATTARLRAPDGCPWDRAQTHRSICDCLVEEVAEVLQAIDRDDAPNLREELGDLLFHIVLHAQMATEGGRFTFEDVAREVNEKMVRRHPHVFGQGAKLGDPEAVIRQWEQIKLVEKGSAKPSLFKQLPPTLSSILEAREVWKELRKKSLDAGPHAAQASILKSAEGLTEAEAGSRLFALVASCREAGIDPDSALRRHTAKVKAHAEGITPL